MGRHEGQVLLLIRPRAQARIGPQHVGPGGGQRKADEHRRRPALAAGSSQIGHDERGRDGRGQQDDDRDVVGDKRLRRRAGDDDAEALVVGEQPQEQAVECGQRDGPAPGDEGVTTACGRRPQTIVPRRVEQVVGRGHPAGVDGLAEGVVLARPHGRLVEMIQLLGVIAEVVHCFLIGHRFLIHSRPPVVARACVVYLTVMPAHAACRAI